MSNSKSLELKSILNYAALGLPLGFIGMPLYVYLPKFYAEELGVSLITLSILLLAARLVDTVQDPLIGWYSDHLAQKRKTSVRKPIIMMCLPLLTLLFLALLIPQPWLSPIAWISTFMILTYTVYSFLSINYYTMAAEISEDYNQQTRLVSAREGFALLGIAIGSIIPSVLLAVDNKLQAHFVTWTFFLVILLLSAFSFYRYAPSVAKFSKPSSEPIFAALKIVINDRAYLILAGTFLLSTIAASLPATIVLFYIEDVLEAKAYFGAFLGGYFICALAGLPLWSNLSSKIGKKRTWELSMVGSIVGFICATFLGPGDLLPYALICILTGFCLGADLSMPFSMLADVVKSSKNKAKYYAIWGMLGKLSLALAGSMGLFVLGLLGYEPGQNVTENTRWSIAISYALIPCIIKLGSLVTLHLSGLDKQENKS